MSSHDWQPPARSQPLTTLERAGILASADPSMVMLEGQRDAAQDIAEAELEQRRREEAGS